MPVDLFVSYVFNFILSVIVRNVVRRDVVIQRFSSAIHCTLTFSFTFLCTLHCIHLDLPLTLALEGTSVMCCDIFFNFQRGLFLFVSECKLNYAVVFYSPSLSTPNLIYLFMFIISTSFYVSINVTVFPLGGIFQQIIIFASCLWLHFIGILRNEMRR